MNPILTQNSSFKWVYTTPKEIEESLDLKNKTYVGLSFLSFSRGRFQFFLKETHGRDENPNLSTKNQNLKLNFGITKYQYIGNSTKLN